MRLVFVSVTVVLATLLYHYALAVTLRRILRNPPIVNGAGVKETT